MIDRSKTVARVMFLNGRIDAFEKIVSGLQERIIRDQEQIDVLKSQLAANTKTAGEQ